jgi:hypothetical protein
MALQAGGGCDDAVWKMRPRLAFTILPALLAAGALAVAASGCGGASAVSLDPVAEAADVTSHTGGVQLALNAHVTATGGATAFDVALTGQGFFNYKAREGELVLHVSGLPQSAQAEIPGGSLDLTELFKSPSVYLSSPLLAGKLPAGARWMKLDLSSVEGALGLSPQQLAGGQTNPAQFIEYLKASGGKVALVGREQVRGVDTTHYRVTVALDKLAGAASGSGASKLKAALSQLGAALGTSGLPLDVWIDGRHLVRRVALALTLPIGPMSLQAHVALDLYGYGATRTVTPPVSSEVFDATGSALSALTTGSD